MNEIIQKRIEEATNIMFGHQAIATEAMNYILANQWISVEEALPQIREKGTENRSWSDWVLVMTHGGGAFIDCYAFHRKEWLNNGNDVTHWMNVPSLEGGEK